MKPVFILTAMAAAIAAYFYYEDECRKKANTKLQTFLHGINNPAAEQVRSIV